MIDRSGTLFPQLQKGNAVSTYFVARMEGTIMWKEFNSVVGKMLHKQHFVPGKGLHVLRNIPEYREY